MKDVFELDDAIFSKIMGLKRAFINGKIPKETYQVILLRLNDQIIEWLETLERLGIEVEIDGKGGKKKK